MLLARMCPSACVRWACRSDGWGRDIMTHPGVNAARTRLSMLLRLDSRAAQGALEQRGDKLHDEGVVGGRRIGHRESPCVCDGLLARLYHTPRMPARWRVDAGGRACHARSAVLWARHTASQARSHRGSRQPWCREGRSTGHGRTSAGTPAWRAGARGPALSHAPPACYTARGPLGAALAHATVFARRRTLLRTTPESARLSCMGRCCAPL